MIFFVSRAFRKSRLLKRLESFKVPQPGEGIAEITITKWLVQPQQEVKEFDIICEVFSDKSSLELKSPYDGTIKELLYKPSDVVKVGDPLYKIDIDDLKYPSGPTSTRQIAAETAEIPVKTSQNVRTAPSVTNLAAIHKINLEKVTGTGKHSMITKEDIINYIADKEKPLESAKYTVLPQSPTHINPPIMPAMTFQINDKLEKLSPIQKAMKKSMISALSIPHFTYCEDICMDELIKLRGQLKANVKNVKFTYMPFLIKALSLSILDFPITNSILLADSFEILLKASHNISFAMDTPQGLVVPNIKNVSSLSIYEIALEMERLQDLGSKGKIPEKDLTGGTIAISNIGSIGGTYAAPVVFPPQVCIGAFGAIRSRLEKSNGKIAEKSIMSSSWSADHRVLDGATTARFVSRWKAIIENPSLMLLHLK